MLSRRALPLFALMCSLLLACSGERGRGEALRVATTTSVRDSGLLAVLVQEFTARSGRQVEVDAVGSGRAIELVRTGQADLAITHSPDDEAQALAAGEVGARTPVMRNEFVLVGPVEDVGVVAGQSDVVGALRAVAGSGRRFVSRSDDSGTHRRERALWQAAGVPLDSSFIMVANAGMGATLERAAREHAFTLSDRATYATRREGLGLAIVFQGGPELDNVYSALEPAPAARADAAGARAFVEFMRSDRGRSLIGGFGVQTYGEPLFAPVD